MRFDWCDSGCRRCFSMLLLLLSLKLKFGRDSEAEFWCYLKAVILVKELYPGARCSIFNMFNEFWKVASILLHGAHQLIFIEKHGSRLGVNTWANWLMSSSRKRFLISSFGCCGDFSQNWLTCSTQEIKFNCLFVWFGGGGLKRRPGWLGALILRQMRESFNYFVFLVPFVMQSLTLPVSD